jgi:hypothetical protein
MLGEIHKKSVFGNRPLQATFRAEIADLAPVYFHMGPKGHAEQRAIKYIAIRKSFFFLFFLRSFVKIYPAL